MEFGLRYMQRREEKGPKDHWRVADDFFLLFWTWMMLKMISSKLMYVKEGQ